METITTANILASMFTENTGRHMLDSGGAYGRNWERNQGRTTESFLNEPEAHFDVFSGDWYPLVSTFHFLNDRLEFSAERQMHFDVWAETMPDDHWMSVIEAYLDRFYDDADKLCVNTYNHENVLDQVIQYWQVSRNGEATYPDFVILQVHGGCDVRGGYTAPKFFDVKDFCEVGLLDDNQVSVCCSGQVPPQVETLPGFPDAQTVYHSWYSDDGGSNWYGDDDDLTNDQVSDEGVPVCPCCSAPLSVHGH